MNELGWLWFITTIIFAIYSIGLVNENERLKERIKELRQ